MPITVEKLRADVEVTGVAKAVAELKAFKAAVRDATTGGGRRRGVIQPDLSNATARLTEELGSLTEAATEAIGTEGGRGGRGGRGIAGLGGSSFGSARRMNRLGVTVAAVSSIVAPAATGINALAGSVLALSGSLAPVTGLLATIPQGITLIGQGAFTAAAGLGGLTDALKEVEGAKSLDAQTQALERLTPEMRAMVDLVRGPLKSAWEGIQNTAQAGFLPGLRDALGEAMPLLEAIRPVVAETANVMGRAARSMGEFLGSEAFGRDFTRIGRSNVRIMDDLADATQSLFEGFTDLMVAAAPLTEAVGEGIAKIAANFADWAETGRTGRLQSFFEDTLEVSRQWKDVLADTGAAIGNVVRAATPLGRDMLGAFERLSAEARAWTGEVSNAEGMRAFFDSLKGPLREMGGLLADIVKAFRDMQNEQQFEEIVQSIRAMLPPLADAFSSMGDIARAASRLGESLAPLLVGAEVFGAMANGLATLLDLVPGLDLLIGGLVAFRIAQSGLKLASLTGGLIGIGREGSFAAAAVGRAKVEIGALGVSASGAALSLGAVGAALAGWAMGAQIVSDNAREGRRHVDEFLSSLDQPQTYAELAAHVNAVGTEFNRLRSNELPGAAHAVGQFIQAIGPWESTLGRDSEAAAYLEAKVGELRREFMAMERMTNQVTASTNVNATAFANWLVQQRNASIVFATAQAALAAYRKEIERTTASLRGGIIMAFSTMATLGRAAAAANREAEDATRDLARAQQDAVVDTRQLRNAQESAADASRDLARSYHEASEHLEDLRFAQRRSVLSEARAVNALEDAYARLAEIQAPVAELTSEITRVTDDFTGKVFEVVRITGKAADAAQDQRRRQRELRDALLGVAEAELAVEEARDRTLDSQLELSEAERRGIDQSEIVVAARRRVRDANEAVTDAVKAQQRAIDENAIAVERAQRRVVDATARQRAAWSDLQKFVDDTLTPAITRYNDELDRLNRTVVTNLDFNLKLKGDDWSWLAATQRYWTPPDMFRPDLLSPDPNRYLRELQESVQGQATGGRSRRGSWSLVGEEGPELVRWASSGTVVPTDDTRGLLTGSRDSLTAGQIERIVTAAMGTGGGVRMENTFVNQSDPKAVADEIAWSLHA